MELEQLEFDLTPDEVADLLIEVHEAFLKKQQELFAEKQEPSPDMPFIGCRKLYNRKHARLRPLSPVDKGIEKFVFYDEWHKRNSGKEPPIVFIINLTSRLGKSIVYSIVIDDQKIILDRLSDFWRLLEAGRNSRLPATEKLNGSAPQQKQTITTPEPSAEVTLRTHSQTITGMSVQDFCKEYRSHTLDNFLQAIDGATLNYLSDCTSPRLHVTKTHTHDEREADFVFSIKSIKDDWDDKAGNTAGVMRVTEVCTGTLKVFILATYPGWWFDDFKIWVDSLAQENTKAIDEQSNDLSENPPVPSKDGWNAVALSENPPVPDKDGWNAVFVWYWKNRDKCQNLQELANIIGYAYGTVKKEHALYQASKK